MVNRYFDASDLEGGLGLLDRHLDQNVTVIDPGATETLHSRSDCGGSARSSTGMGIRN